MPTRPLLDLSKVDFEQVLYDRSDLERFNPHRGAMAQLDGVIWHDEPVYHAVAYRNVRDDEFWVTGHIPGNPLLPGVLMVESGAQLASFMYYKRSGLSWFAGFTRIEDTVFRGHVVPGDRMILIAECVKYHEKRFVSKVQGLVDDAIVFESKITGMAFPKLGDVRTPSKAVSIAE